MSKSPDKLVKEAKKALKTGLFKWSKDYVKAAMLYDEAAKKYMALKDYENAIYVYEQLIPV
jgi:tetratricopeptide (TPR) repeat protein